MLQKLKGRGAFWPTGVLCLRQKRDLQVRGGNRWPQGHGGRARRQAQARLPEPQGRPGRSLTLLEPSRHSRTIIFLSEGGGGGGLERRSTAGAHPLKLSHLPVYNVIYLIFFALVRDDYVSQRPRPVTKTLMLVLMSEACGAEA